MAGERRTCGALQVSGRPFQLGLWPRSLELVEDYFFLLGRRGPLGDGVTATSVSPANVNLGMSSSKAN